MEDGRVGRNQKLPKDGAAPDSALLSQKPGLGSPGTQRGSQYLLTDCICNLADSRALGLGAARWGRAGGKLVPGLGQVGT